MKQDKKREMGREKRTQRAVERGRGREQKGPQRERGKSGDTKDGLGGMDRQTERETATGSALPSAKESAGDQAPGLGEGRA